MYHKEIANRFAAGNNINRVESGLKNWKKIYYGTITKSNNGRLHSEKEAASLIKHLMKHYIRLIAKTDRIKWVRDAITRWTADINKHVQLYNLYNNSVLGNMLKRVARDRINTAKFVLAQLNRRLVTLEHAKFAGSKLHALAIKTRIMSRPNFSVSWSR